MSIIKDLVAGGAAGLFSGMGEFAKSIREAITGEAILDPNKRAELLAQTAALEAASEKARYDFEAKMSEAQTAINLAEAQSGSTFKGGWRPFIGWTCGAGLAYQFLFRSLVPWIVQVIALVAGKTVDLPVLPELDLASMLPLIMGMLGLGAFRTYEKIKK